MNSNGIMRRFLSLEELATGVANHEVEFVFYAKVDFAWLASAATAIEDHEQWEIKIPKVEGNQTGGRMRVRRTQTQGAEPEYVQTVKTKLAEGGEKEIATVSSADGFEQFKAMSARGMVKRRHLVDCPERTSPWEVDVFFNEDGSPHEWVKIDFELQAGESGCPALHAQFKDVKRAAAPEDAQFVRDLYDAVFLKANQPSASQ